MMLRVKIVQESRSEISTWPKLLSMLLLFLTAMASTDTVCAHYDAVQHARTAYPLVQNPDLPGILWRSFPIAGGRTVKSVAKRLLSVDLLLRKSIAEKARSWRCVSSAD